ncbi:MAG TPA: (Fe-S)-binding protein [Myxococcota bacterium]|nr:(Fe-S)-binding protein [Myxococcota bacterium]HRY96870.1 (Fe-S)-binding protein [Myxococcota bacterium]
MDPSLATRQLMWNISPAWLMYALFGLSLAVFGFGLWRRVSVWRRGKAAGERLSDLGKRFWLLVKEIVLQRRVRREGFPGWFHSFVFYSFAVLVLVTAVVALDYDFGTTFFRGWIYLLLSGAAELAGALVLVGVGMAAWRRYLRKPKTLEHGVMDGLSLLLIGLIVLTGFVAEGLRIVRTGEEFPYFSLLGWGLSFLFTGLSDQAARGLHAGLWWTHLGLAFGWIASLPFTKFFHILALPANVFFSKLEARGKLRRQDIEALMSAEDFDESKFNVGTATTAEFSWKQRLDLDACIACGRCEDVCPATLAGQPFGPRQLISKLKAATQKGDTAARRGPASGQAPAEGEAPAAEAPPAGAAIVGEALDEDFIWYCRTCTACMEVCPAMIEHVDTLIDVRRNEVVMQGRLPAEAARALKMLERLGNPFGPQSDRIAWVKSMGIRDVRPGEKCDVIYWIGCCTTFDPTKQRIAQDLCRLLQRCGIEFGVIGQDESCCGDPARVLGQEALFQEIAKKQIAELKKREFQVLLVSCPHCYNTLKNEYSQFGADFNVVHHSEFLHEMLWSGTLQPVQGEQEKTVYHDPCYLGRYQRIFDAPRQVLKAVPGMNLVEMKQSRDVSLCCGGGGGHYWMDLKKGERINNLRVKQAEEAGAARIVTSCSYCMQMLNDSVKAMDLDEKIEVIDLASLVLKSLGPSPADARPAPKPAAEPAAPEPSA